MDGDGDYRLGVFRRGAWWDLDLDFCGAADALETAAAWMPWSPPGEAVPAIDAQCVGWVPLPEEGDQ